MSSQGGESQQDHLGIMSSVISHQEQKRRKRGDPVIIKRQIFFEGVVYQIEEELYSDSDHSSVYTSEDEFEEDKGLQSQFKQSNRVLSRRLSQDEPVNKPSIKIDDDATAPDSAAKKPPSALSRKQSLSSNKSPSKIKEEDKTSGTKSMKKKVSVKEESPTKVPASAALEKKKTAITKPGGAKKKGTSYSKDKQALMREYFVNDEGLTDAQKVYETKIGAKHYRPDHMEKRIKHQEDTF